MPRYRARRNSGTIDCYGREYSITAAVFSAFLKCPTKALLVAIGEPAPGSFVADIEARRSSMYKAAAKQRLRVGAEVAELLDFGERWRSLDYEAITHHVDCETAVYDFAVLVDPIGLFAPDIQIAVITA